MKPSTYLLPLLCRHHNRTTPTWLTVSLSISRSPAATLASLLRMATSVPCRHPAEALDLCRREHCPRRLLVSCWQPTELLRESLRRGNSLGSHHRVLPFSLVRLLLLVKVFFFFLFFFLSKL